VAKGEPRTVVIGLDGASYDLLRRWTAVNELPSLTAIMREGTWGRLDSVLPYQSVAAWTSFITGTSPAKHGHFDFVTRVPGTRTVSHVNNASSIDGRTLWTMLGEGGKRIGILNVPVTYPVTPVNGFMIPDWLTPSLGKSPTYPPEVGDELRRKFGDYLFEFRSGPYELGRQREQRFLDELYRTTERRAESALYLFETRPWDFFMVVFTGPDTLQHFLWHYTDPTHPRHDPTAVAARGDAVLNYYRLLDGIVGEFRRHLAPETRLFVMSDHGFGPFVKMFNVNKLLMDLGLLLVEPAPMKSRSALLSIIERVDVFNLRQRFSRRLRQRVFNWIMTPPVDWSRTKAYSGTPTEGGIYINVRGRGPNGVVRQEEYDQVRDAISAAVLGVRDPETGGKVVERIYRKEELYRGRYLAQMPDLLLVVAPGYELVESFEQAQMFLPPTLRRTGTHRPEGVLLATGPGILQGREIAPASLLDVTPTLLYVNGLPISRDMDGRLLDIFDGAFRGQTAPRYAEGVEVSVDTPRQPGWDREGEEEVQRRLRDLGYLE
jgi:predicted AlkP superfamily phosphohydrolase/phosphomutase